MRGLGSRAGCGSREGLVIESLSGLRDREYMYVIAPPPESESAGTSDERLV